MKETINKMLSNLLLKLDNKISNNKKPLLILFSLMGLALIIRLYYIPYQIPISLDGIDYFAYTVAIEKEGYFPTGYLPLNFGWSTFLAPVFWIVGSNEMLELMNIQRIMSSIISVSTAIPIYFICKTFFKKNISILGAALFLFDPRIIENSILGISDPLFIFFVTLTIMFIFIKKSKFFYISFIFVALAGFTRYEGLLLLIPSLASFFIRKNFDNLTVIKLSVGLLLFFLIIIFINLTAYENSDIDIAAPLFSFPNYLISNFVVLDNPNSNDKMFSENIENVSQIFPNNPITTYLVYLGWIMIPILGLFIIPGFFLTKKKITKNKIIFGIFFGVMSLSSLYAYARGIEETRYLYPLIPILILFACQFFDYTSKKWNIKKLTIIVITIIIILSIMFLEYKKVDYNHEKESFLISKDIVNLTTVINADPIDGNYLTTSKIIQQWPDINLNLSDKKFKYSSSEFNSVEEFIIKYEKNGLSHIVTDGKDHGSKFISDIFYNEYKYPYLTKIYDSTENDYEYKVIIFKINYEKFYEIEIKKIDNKK